MYPLFLVNTREMVHFVIFPNENVPTVHSKHQVDGTFCKVSHNSWSIYRGIHKFPDQWHWIKNIIEQRYGQVFWILWVGIGWDELNWIIIIIIIIIIYPLTLGVVVAPQMISQPISSSFSCSLLPSGTWQTPGPSIPWCCLPTSSSVCLVFLFWYA